MRPSRFSFMALGLLAAATAACSAAPQESSRMDWRQNGRQLALDGDNGVVRVRAASPAGHFGVQAGDQVVRAGNTPVARVSDLTTALAGATQPTVTVTVLRDGRQVQVPVATAAWRAVVPPAPPAPPAPPRT